MNIEKNISLLPYTTFGINCYASTFIEYDNIDELVELIHNGIFKSKYLHIGAGSNLLFTKDFQGTVIHSRIKQIEWIDNSDSEFVLYRVGSGVVMDDFILFCTENQIFGLENLSGIPGEVGSSAVQNIGAYGTEAEEYIHTVETINIFTGEKRNFTHEECKYGYRYSIFKEEKYKKYIVTSVIFKLKIKESYELSYKGITEELDRLNLIPTLQNIRNTIITIRDKKLPDYKVFGNAGSFFKNPIVAKSHIDNLRKKYPQLPCYEISTDTTSLKVSAAWLIQECGLKGKSIGGATVYENQPLVIINKNNASGSDVQRLAEMIITSVKEQFEIELSPEVNIF
ncbi:MAG: UDP-N-acetylmuramate dehydrogenase [bacterium]